MKKTIVALSTVLVSLSATSAMATNFKVEITNLTNAAYFTPILVAAHRRTSDMFELGEAASPELQAMAEGGDVSGLQTILDSEGADTDIAVTESGGPFLAPGETATALVKARGNNSRLSIGAMILPTNDAFVGLDSLRLRGAAGKTVFLYAHDAGTEANNELINPGAGGVPGTAGIPGDPSGLSGTGGTGVGGADHNHSVHIHRGIVGDSDAFGGASDLDETAHRWDNPVAMVTIQRVSRHYSNE